MSGLVFAQSLAALERILGLGGIQVTADLGLFGIAISKVGIVFRGDLVKRGFRDVDIALIDEGGSKTVQHGKNQRADLEAVHIGIGADDDFIPAQIVQIEKELKLLIGLGGDLHAAAQHLQDIGDDIALKDADIIGLEAVEDLAAHRHDGLKFTCRGPCLQLPRAESPSTM